MSRSTPEWIGKTDDAAIPTRVRLRVFEAQGGKCALTGHKIRPGDVWQIDHKVALINGGSHRESNLQAALAAPHREKTKADVAAKSKAHRLREKHLGMRPKKSALSHPTLKRRMDGTVVRREPQ